MHTVLPFEGRQHCLEASSHGAHNRRCLLWWLWALALTSILWRLRHYDWSTCSSACLSAILGPRRNSSLRYTYLLTEVSVITKVQFVREFLHKVAPASTEAWVNIIIWYRSPFQTEVSINRYKKCIKPPLNMSECEVIAWRPTKHTVHPSIPYPSCQGGFCPAAGRWDICNTQHSPSWVRCTPAGSWPWPDRFNILRCHHSRMIHINCL